MIPQYFVQDPVLFVPRYNPVEPLPLRRHRQPLAQTCHLLMSKDLSLRKFVEYSPCSKLSNTDSVKTATIIVLHYTTVYKYKFTNL
jgi:hypothetical protein